MNVQVRLFARARDLAGSERVEVELPDAATVGDLRMALGEAFPSLRSLVPNLLVAIGNDYAPDAARIGTGAEIACFPPVSGG